MSIAAGMVGALVMPHNIFLHSALVQSREIDLTSTSAKKEAIMYNAIESALSLGVTVIINLSLMSVFASGFHNRPELGITEVGLGSAGRCELSGVILYPECSCLKGRFLARVAFVSDSDLRLSQIQSNATCSYLDSTDSEC